LPRMSLSWSEVAITRMILCLACCQTLSSPGSPSTSSEKKEHPVAALTTPCCNAAICSSCFEVPLPFAD
jgi:hypothetical protein